MRIIYKGLAELKSTDIPLATLQYMRPQAVSGEMPSMADDVYAVGITTYELLFGSHPYEQLESFPDVVHAIHTGKLELPDSPAISPYISPSARDFILSLTSLDSLRRPSAVRALLHSWLTGFMDQTLPRSAAAPRNGSAQRRNPIMSVASVVLVTFDAVSRQLVVVDAVGKAGKTVWLGVPDESGMSMTTSESELDGVECSSSGDSDSDSGGGRLD
ncbi:kinase-like domain-containing protein [Hyaloraphidium curvatum]|nr:kinase-like domain-containing protein [Hyaloraphidium curvatum]